MEIEKRRFFVIGYPRSRTAWLSVFLNGDGVRCEHEATPEEMDAWPERIVGTCNSGLLFSVPELVAKYPDAHWVLIERDSRDALNSIIADRPHAAAMWLEKWPLLEGAMEKAKEAIGKSHRIRVPYADISDEAGRIYFRCAGRYFLDEPKLAALKNLRITQIPPAPPATPEAVRQSAIERLAETGIDLTGLTVRSFAPTDLLLFSEWASREHGQGVRLLPLLPPLGVVIEDGKGPAAMLFCRESYGVPAADLEFAVTRPGMGMKESSAALAFAVAACIELAGKLVVPPAVYTVFRITCRRSMGRFAKRLGFLPHGPEDCQKFIYQKT